MESLIRRIAKTKYVWESPAQRPPPVCHVVSGVSRVPGEKNIDFVPVCCCNRNILQARHFYPYLPDHA